MSKPLFFVFLNLLVIGPSKSQQQAKQFFSITPEMIFAKYFFYPEVGGNKLVSKPIHTGLGIELNFRGRHRFGVSVGMQVIPRSFYVEAPASADTHRFLGVSHSSGVTALPVYINYLAYENRHLKIFLRGGLLLTRSTDNMHYDYTYPAYPAFAEKGRRKTHNRGFIAWSVGFNVERNLYKRDFYLSVKLYYVREFWGNKPGYVSNTTNRLCASVGINIMISNILYKNKIKTLRNYPW